MIANSEVRSRVEPAAGAASRTVRASVFATVAAAILLYATAGVSVNGNANAAVRLVGVTSEGDAILIESSEPAMYSVSRPDPLRLVIDMRNVSIADAHNDVSKQGPVSGVRLEQATSSDGRSLARVHLELTRPSEYSIRSARNTIRVELSPRASAAARTPAAPATAAAPVTLMPTSLSAPASVPAPAPAPAPASSSAQAPASQPPPTFEKTVGPATLLERIRSSKNAGATTVTLSGNGTLNQPSTAESKDLPRRLVLDFANLTSKAPSQTAVDSKLVTKVRVGLNSQQPLITRVVMEIAGTANYHFERSGDRGRDLDVVFEQNHTASSVVITPDDPATATPVEPEPPLTLQQAMANVASITPPESAGDPITALKSVGRSVPEAPIAVERETAKPKATEKAAAAKSTETPAAPKATEKAAAPKPTEKAAAPVAAAPSVTPPAPATPAATTAAAPAAAPATPATTTPAPSARAADTTALPAQQTPQLAAAITPPAAPAAAPTSAAATASAPAPASATANANVPAAAATSQRRDAQPLARTQAAPQQAAQQQPPAPPPVQGIQGGPQQRQFTGHPISLDFEGVDLRAVLRTFADVSGLNMVIDPDVQGTVDIKLTDVPWDQALDVILRGNQLDYSVDGTIVRISRIRTLEDENKARQAATQAAAERAAQAGGLSFETFPLSYAKAADLAPLLKGSLRLSRYGQVQVDTRTNTLIIADLPDQFPSIRELLKTLDRAEPQVEVEARIVQTTRDFARAIGVQWGLNGRVMPDIGNTTGLAFPNQGTLGGRLGGAQGPTGDPRATDLEQTSSAVRLGVPDASSAIGLALGAVNGAFNLDVALSALERSGKGRVLSTPRLTTQNNIEAEVAQGVQIPIQVVSNNTVTVTFKDAVLILKVTPQITAANTVIMKITIENATADFSRQVNGIPPVDTQRANTQVQIDDGATTVIGGIFVSTEQTSQGRTPLLYRIPILGWLFKNDRVEDGSRELLIFITPRILKG